MPADDTILRSREQPRLWLIHIATASFAAFFVMLPAALFDWSGGVAFAVAASMVAAVIVWDIARCRTVTIAPSGLTVGTRTFAWDDIASTRVREIPIARAGIFVELTEAARRRHGRPQPHYRDFGFGLAPAPTPELAAQRFDLFIRAHRARLETWFTMISLYELRRMRTEMMSAMGRAGLLPPAAIQAAETQAAARVFASLISPVELSDDPRAEACLDHVKAAARSQIAGAPRAIAAIFAARK